MSFTPTSGLGCAASCCTRNDSLRSVNVNMRMHRLLAVQNSQLNEPRGQHQHLYLFVSRCRRLRMSDEWCVSRQFQPELCWACCCQTFAGADATSSVSSSPESSSMCCNCQRRVIRWCDGRPQIKQMSFAKATQNRRSDLDPNYAHPCSGPLVLEAEFWPACAAAETRRVQVFGDQKSDTDMACASKTDTPSRSCSCGLQIQERGCGDADLLVPGNRDSRLRRSSPP